MSHFKLICILTACLFNTLVYAESLSDKIDALIDQKLPHAVIGIYVKDAQTGQVIYSRNADKMLSPASGTKLFTAAAALYQLKPNYSFLTTLSQKNQDYYLTFSGSPSLTTDNLKDLILSLKQNGVTTIGGNLVLDDTKFKPPYNAGGDSFDDLGWYYAAPTTALILNGNAMTYEFISAEELGKPVQIKAKNQGQGLNIINQLITVDKEQEKQHCSMNISVEPENTLRLFGCLSKTKQPRVLRLAVTDPMLLASQIIQKTLAENKISIRGKIIAGKTPADAEVIAGVQSKKLTQLITHMLYESDNLYAGSLYKELGYSLTGEGSYKQGTYAIKKILAQNTHMDLKQIELEDGAGIRYNLVTAEQVVTLLDDLYHDPKLQAILLKALPQTGVSGSLKERMKKTALEKQVYAKTGTMHDISSLSGFVHHSDNQTYIFSIIINGVNQPITVAKSLEEQILLLIAGKEKRTEG